MITHLFRWYRASPFWLRNVIGRVTWPLRVALLPFRSIRVGGYRMVLDYADNASFKYLADRENYERTEISAFLSAIAGNAPALVVDIGAHYGAFTLAAGTLIRTGEVSRVIAVEPDPRPFRALARSVARNGWQDHIQVVQAIAGESAGMAPLFVNARSSADNRTHAVTTSPIRVREQHTVPCVMVDDLVAGAAAGQTLVIKIDIQGNEVRALRGLRRTLASVPRWVLFFEHCPYLVESAGIPLDTAEAELAALAADQRFEFGPSSIRPLRDTGDLQASFARLARQRRSNMEGAGTNYVFARGAHLSFPAN